MNSSALEPNNVCQHANEMGLCLEIRRGRTEHPVRPVAVGKFLIGSGDECDLRLGGDDMPPLHSILQYDGQDLWLEAVAAAPALRLNGTVVNSVLLRNGDRLEIGAFELLVRLERMPRGLAAAPAAQVGESQRSVMDSESEWHPDRLREMSTEQLIDALDRELRLVEHFERRQKLGLDALWAAIQQHGQPMMSATGGELPVAVPIGNVQRSPLGPSPAADPQSLSQLDDVVEQLRDVIRTLDERSLSLHRRELAYTEVAATLIEVQERITGQLENIQRQLAEQRDAERSEDHRPRASA